MVLDVPVLGDEQDDDEYAYADELNLDLRGEARRPGKRGLRALHIGYLLQMVLQDAQTRLFFKAQSVIQSEIRYYVPKAEDLDYPQRLIGELRLWMLSSPCLRRRSCSEACDWPRDQGEGKRQPALPTEVARQAGHLVSDVAENGVGAIPTS